MKLFCLANQSSGYDQRDTENLLKGPIKPQEYGGHQNWKFYMNEFFFFFVFQLLKLSFHLLTILMFGLMCAIMFPTMVKSPWSNVLLCRPAKFIEVGALCAADISSNKLNSVAFSLYANYTDRAIAALSAKIVPTLADRGCHVVSATDPYGR
jgi:hypothetical protein